MMVDEMMENKTGPVVALCRSVDRRDEFFSFIFWYAAVSYALPLSARSELFIYLECSIDKAGGLV